MKIIPNVWNVLLITLYFSLNCFGVYFCYSEPESYLCKFIICILIVFLTVQIYVNGRIYHYDENGCTISFLWHKKLFKWEDLEIKKYRPICIAYGHGCLLAEGVFFSVRPYTNLLIETVVFSFLRPFSSFYVIFDDEDLPLDECSHPLVDKNYFLSHMKQWGVEIEGVDKA